MSRPKQKVKSNLVLEWSALLEALHADPAHRASPHLYDPRFGLGVLARLMLLRDVFHEQLCKDAELAGRLAPPRDAWVTNIETPQHAKDLFRVAALSGEPSPHAIAVLRNPAWRQSLCDGFSCDGHRVRGLNSWFKEHYRGRLPGGTMSAEALFETRFFGSTAIDNFLAFVRTGLHRPGVNRALLDRQFGPGGRLADEPRLRLDDLAPEQSECIRTVASTLASADNSGRPIVAITCVGAPRHLTQLADLVLQQLGAVDKNVCYVPIHRQFDDLGAEAGGVDSIVEVLHRFAQGRFDLATDAVPAAPALQDDASLARLLDDIRAFCARTPTVFVFDGYRRSQGPYSAIADFVSDEPVTRLLRHLLHPDAGKRLPVSVRPFAGTFFLVVGDEVPAWARTHLHAEVRFDFEGPLKRNFALRTIARSRAQSSPRDEHAARERLLVRIANEATFAFAENYFEAVAWMVRRLPDEAVAALEPYVTSPDFHERLFDDCWNALDREPWVRVFLLALAVSHTGLREGSAGQLLDVHARHFGKRLVSPDVQPVEAAVFRDFVATASAAGAGIVNRFPRGADDRLAEQTAYAAQTFSAWALAHQWMPGGRPVAFALRSRRFRRQVLSKAARADTVAVSRILAEICLQSYRMLCVELPPAARRQRRACRWLTEALYYGMNSLELDRPRRLADEGAVHGPVRIMPGYMLGEIPDHPVSAYAFLYFTVFKELLCGGNIASIGRESGNGELELELLRFCGNPSVGASEREGQPAEGDKRRWTSPVVHGLLHGPPIGLSRVREAFVHHLLEYCRAARRASRPRLLREALAAIRDNFPPQGLSPEQRLAVLKFTIDLWMLDPETPVDGRPLPFALARALPRTIAAAHGTDARCARNLLRAVAALGSEGARFMEGLVTADSHLDVRALDEIVEKAFAAIDKAVAVDMLSPDAVALLARVAIVWAGRLRQAVVGGNAREAARRAGSALAAFWLLKRVGARRQTRNPMARPARVGWQVAEAYLHLVGEVKLLLRRLRSFDTAGAKTEWLERRLQRTGRRTLDTFLREQGGDHADHIVALILESKFVRLFGARAAPLVRLQDRDAPTRDLRLAPLLSAHDWLRQAEREVLDFTARPSIRVLLCEERVHLCTEILDRAALRPPKEPQDALLAVRPLLPMFSSRLYTFLDLIVHDLTQLTTYCDFIDGRDDASQALRGEWRRIHDGCRAGVRDGLARWVDDADVSSHGAQWNEAVRRARALTAN